MSCRRRSPTVSKSTGSRKSQRRTSSHERLSNDRPGSLNLLSTSRSQEGCVTESETTPVKTGRGPTMTTSAHLWAVGYDDVARAAQVRDVITNLGWGNGRAGKYLILEDIAVVVRHADGSFTFDREPFPKVANVLGCTAVG